MNVNHSRILRFSLALLGTFTLALVMWGQQSNPGQKHISLVTDWSQRHMIYSAPRSEMQIFQIGSEPRYIQQYYRRFGPGGGHTPFPSQNEGELKRDWSMNMGSGSTGLIAAIVGAGQSPAKFSFGTTTANCASATPPDFVVYNTSAVPATTTTAHGTVTFTSDPGGANTTTITPTHGTAVTYLWHQPINDTDECNPGGVDVPCVLHGTTGVLAIDAENLEAAINDNPSQCGSPQPCFLNISSPNASVTAAASGSVTSLTSTTAGAGGDFTLSGNQTFSGGSGGSNAQASIIAYDNLYSGCTGTVPQIYWAYNTSGTVVTSPVLSADGSQVAFIHSSGSGASLVLLRWVAGEGSTYNTTTNAAAPDDISTSGIGYVGCKGGAVSCMLTLVFANGANDTNSSPFYDYADDVLYVADNTGHIHQFAGVFNGTPAEVGNPWVTLTSGNVVTSVIYDSISGRVFAGDSGGYLYNVACTISSVATPCSTAGVTTAVNKSAQLSNGTDGGIFDAPIVDGTAAQVYVFAANNTAGTNRSSVWQLPTNFMNGATAPGSEVISTTSATAPIFAGDFDNAYYTSSSGSSPSGNLYVCGTVGGDPALYQIAISSDSMTGVTTGPTLTTGAATCSGVTEFFNTTDLIFVSVTTNALTSIGGRRPAALY